MMKKLTLYILFTVICLTAIAPTALATYSIPGEYQPSNIAESWAEAAEGESVGDDYGARSVTYILGDLISGILAITGVLAVYFLVSNGFKYAISFGQQDKIDQAKKGIMWAIGGLLIIMLSYSIVKMIVLC